MTHTIQPEAKIQIYKHLTIDPVDRETNPYGFRYNAVDDKEFCLRVAKMLSWKYCVWIIGMNKSRN